MTERTPRASVSVQAHTPAPTGRRALILWCLVLTVTAFLQSPGRIAADTKLDLFVDPWGFLSHATHAWSNIFPLGQIQNQAYGYIFPQGLFFAIFSWAPAWIVQRAWWALLLCVGFLGFVRLAEQIRCGSPSSRILAALLYTLCPRILTTLGAISSEAWPVALAPWVLIPVSRLHDASVTRKISWRTIWRRALGSAMAVLCIGAVNATATFAAVLPAIIWLLFAGVFEGRRRRKAALKFILPWTISLAAVSAWWVGPLLVMGAYAPPFTDYIESASVTTRWTSLVEVLRGTDSWSSYASTERIAGSILVSEPTFVLITGVCAAVRLAGLSMVGLPRRRPWLVMFITGLTIVCAGSIFGPFAPNIHHFLDTAGVALRNIHKFDPLIRLPLAMGIAHLTGRLTWAGILTENRPQHGPLAVGAKPAMGARLSSILLHPECYKRLAGSTAVILVAIMATAPAWSGRLAPEKPFTTIPNYWYQTADWLNANAQNTRTMIVPSSSFARQDWGLTRDEPLQPLLTVPWVVRDAIPLVPPGAIRALDGIDESLSTGNSSPTLAHTLANQGIGYLVVRTDLERDSTPTTTNTDSGASGSTKGARTSSRKDSAAHTSTYQSEPAISQETHDLLATLHSSPGFEAVATFGKVQILKVNAEPTPPTTQPLLVNATDLQDASAAPEALERLDAADTELRSRREGKSPETEASSPMRLLRSQVPAGITPTDSTATDTPALRERNYGIVNHAESAIMSPLDTRRTLNEVQDYAWSGGTVTSIATQGGTLTASSSASDPDSLGGAQTEHSLTSAVDHQSNTWWMPSLGKTAGAWLQLNPLRAINSGSIRFTTVGERAGVTVSTDAGSIALVAEPGEETGVSLPPGTAHWVRITATAPTGDFGLSEVTLNSTDAGAQSVEAASDSTTTSNSSEDDPEQWGVDVTPRRIPIVAVPDSAKRYLFGQEITETTMIRGFVTKAAQTMEVDSSACALTPSQPPSVTVDGEKITECGQKIDLNPGFHMVTSTDRWTALTSPSFTPITRADQGITSTSDGEQIAAADHTRLLVIPEATNPGQQATIGGHTLTQATVNGWQQAWVVPQGVSGTLTITFTPDKPYRQALLIGGVTALAAVLAWGALLFQRRRTIRAEFGRAPYPHNTTFTDLHDPADHFNDLISSRFPSGFKATLLSITLGVTSTVIAGIPGLITAFACIGFHGFLMWKWGARLAHRASVIAAFSGMCLATILLSYLPWPHTGYLGDSWITELLCVISLSAIFSSHVIPIPHSNGTAPRSERKERAESELAESDAESAGSDAESAGSDAESAGSDAESAGSDAESAGSDAGSDAGSGAPAGGDDHARSKDGQVES